MQDDHPTSMLSPDSPAMESFTSAAAAVDRLEALYTQATQFLSDQFLQTVSKGHPGRRVRAYYPEIRLTVTSFDQVDTRLAFGHVSAPGPMRPRSRGPTFSATI